jgi:hypothetical protein
MMDDVHKAFAAANKVDAGLFSFNSEGACANSRERLASANEDGTITLWESGLIRSTPQLIDPVLLAPPRPATGFGQLGASLPPLKES